jgi:hypothetical protein
MRLIVMMTLLCAPSVGCDDAFGLCENRLTQTIPSPDGTLDAAVFSRDCGATVATSAQVSVLAHGTRPKGPGTIFIADSNHGAVAIDLEVVWKAPAELAIAYPARARVFKKEERLGGVHVAYATLSP